MGAGPWLVSMAMWFNCMPFVNNGGVTVRDKKAMRELRESLETLVGGGTAQHRRSSLALSRIAMDGGLECQGQRPARFPNGAASWRIPDGS